MRRRVAIALPLAALLSACAGGPPDESTSAASASVSAGESTSGASTAGSSSDGSGSTASSGATSDATSASTASTTASSDTTASTTASSDATSDATSSTSASSDPTSSTTADATSDASTTADPTDTEGGTTGVDGCAYELVYEAPGELLTMTYEDSYYSAHPLPPGSSFFCMKIEFDMQTVDSLAQTLMDFPGCPIFTGIAAIRGDTKAGKLLGGALFKKYKVGCTVGPDRLELDTFVEGVVVNGPWPLGELYHFELVVEPFTSRLTAYKDGVQVGPSVEASIEGATVDMARDPIIELGMKKPAGDAYFPDYGGTYSNLKVWAEVVP